MHTLNPFPQEQVHTMFGSRKNYTVNIIIDGLDTMTQAVVDWARVHDSGLVHAAQAIAALQLVLLRPLATALASNHENRIRLLCDGQDIAPLLYPCFGALYAPFLTGKSLVLAAASLCAIPADALAEWLRLYTTLKDDSITQLASRLVHALPAVLFGSVSSDAGFSQPHLLDPDAVLSALRNIQPKLAARVNPSVLGDVDPLIPQVPDLDYRLGLLVTRIVRSTRAVQCLAVLSTLLSGRQTHTAASPRTTVLEGAPAFSPVQLVNELLILGVVALVPSTTGAVPCRLSTESWAPAVRKMIQRVRACCTLRTQIVD